jgi:hypothetical protein
LCAVIVAASIALVGIAQAGSGPSVGGAGGETSYNVGATPTLDGVADAPWNTSQGDPTLGTPYYGQTGPSGATSLLFPTYTPSSNPTYETTIGGITAPNLAVYPTGGTGPSGQTGETVPYPSGVAGTPGPDDDYCANGGAYTNENGAVNAEPLGVTLPFSPYYFPDIVRNADGSLTGYFDYRPKDTDEAITVARSTDGGVTWTTEGEALEQNPGYCPVADTNDDGQGHPFVTASPSGGTDLYTLQRAAGDNAGIGLLVHHVNPSASNPLSALPASQSVGIDPNTFAAAAVPVGASGSSGVSIPVSTLGSAGSPEQIVGASYEDVPVGSTAPSSSTIINCTGPTSDPATPGSGSLTGCTSATSSPVSVGVGDDLIQVIATANPQSTSGSTPCQGANTVTVPAGPNNPAATGGLSAFCFTQPSTTVAPITAYWWGSLAPDRVYVDGHTMYCDSVSSGLVKFENCTSPTGPFTATEGDAITADPITPPTATMTTGLLAPDGIIGALPNYTSSAAYSASGGEYNGQSVPSNATVVLYTEKLANYFIEGTVNGEISKSGNYSSGTVTLPLSASFTPPQTQAQWLNYQPSVGTTEPLPDQYPSSGSFTVYVGVTDTTGNFIQALNCTSWEPGSMTTGTKPPAGSVNLIGCNGQGTSAESVASGTDVGGPNAAVVPYSVIGQIGEGANGKTSGPTTLFGNNEDYEVVRAAYTTNGVDFTDLGAISGSSSGTGVTSGSYNDISNPFQQASPLSAGLGAVNSSLGSPVTACGGSGEVSCQSPADLTPGSTDTVELRFPGSRGTVIQNPDGSYGMFLSGAWPTDADSDAYNQTFYTSSTDGVHWTTPQVVLSTDYTFAASAAQDNALAGGSNIPLGISAYYSGRAYGPAVVQNPNGTLTMVFAGYRVPKGMPKSDQVLGTHSGAQWTIGQTDPALYRNILTMTLASSTSPGVVTTSTVSNPSSPDTYGSQVTYTDTVAVNSPGTGIPTGTVDFYDGGNPISGCQNVALSDTATDTAVCQTTPSSAGTHTITATYSGDSNYAGSTNSPAFSEQVGPASLTITASSPSMTYGGTVPAVGAGYSGFVNGDTSASLSSLPVCVTAATSSSSVSSSPSTSCSGAADSNYTISYVNGSVSVGPAPLTANVSGSQTYGSSTQAFGVDSYSGFQNSDGSGVVSGTPVCSTSGVDETAAVGFYTGTLSCGGLSAANYTISYGDDGFTVDPASLTITASSPSMTYGGTVPAVGAGYSGFVNGDTSASLSSLPVCVTTATSSSSVSSSPSTSCSGAADSNYTISYVNGSVSVGPASLTITASSPSMTYGGTVPAVDAAYSGFVNGDSSASLSSLPVCVTAATSSSSVSSSPSTSCSGAADPNYTISYVDGNVSVGPASLTITAPSPTTTYGTVPTPTAGYSGFVNGDTASSLTTAPTCSTTDTPSAPVGSSPTTSCSGAVDANYTISYVDGSVTVTPALLTITASSPTTTYGGSVPAITAGYSGFVDSETAASLTTQPTCTTAATSASPVSGSPYPTHCSGAADPNYTISYVQGGLDVSPAELMIIASSGSMSYGGTPPKITASYSGFVLGQGSKNLTTLPTCGSTATSSSGVADSPYESTCSGAVDPNYEFVYVSGTVTVNPDTLKITASSASLTYGGTVPTITASYSGFKHGDTPASLSTAPTCGTTATSTSPVSGSPYVTTCSGALDANYTISYVNGTLTVKPAALKITASSASATYGDAVPVVTASYSGFVNGETSASLTTLPTCTTTMVSGSPVSGSPYSTSCSGAVDSNYTISYVRGKISLVRAPLTITASSGSMVYGGSVPAVTASYSGFVNGESASDLTTLPTCATNATSSSSVAGSPYITHCADASDPNYIISYVRGTMTVAPAATSLSYTGPAQVATSGSLQPSASLSSTAEACKSAQPIVFSLDPNPLTGANTSYKLETPLTNGSGTATGASLSAKHWLVSGGYTLTATYAGTPNCVGSTASAPFTVSP